MRTFRPFRSIYECSYFALSSYLLYTTRPDLGMLNRGGGKCRYLLVPRLNDLGTRPQEQSSLETVNWTDHAQCMQMNSIDMGLYYDSTVTLTCKLLFAAAKAIFDVGPDVSLAVIGHRLLDWFPDPSSEGESGEGSNK